MGGLNFAYKTQGNYQKIYILEESAFYIPSNSLSVLQNYCPIVITFDTVMTSHLAGCGLAGALAKSPQDSPPPVAAGWLSRLAGVVGRSTGLSTLPGEPIFDATAGAGGGASFTLHGGGGRSPPAAAPALGLGRFVPSCPSFFCRKM